MVIDPNAHDMMAHLENHLIYADAFQMSPSEATAVPAKLHGIVKEAVIKAVNGS